MDDVEYATCPYNKSHVIRVHRMPYHLIKCKKSYTGPPLDTCPYNAQHLIPQGTLTEHYQTCTAFYLFNQNIFAAQAQAELTATALNPPYDDGDESDE